MTTSRFLTDRGEPRAFVIIASARSGSNLLVSYLRQVSRAACFGEILREPFPETPRWERLVKRLDMPPDARRLHAEDVAAFWELFLARGLRRRRWVGAKVFYSHRRGDPVWERFGAPDHRVLHLWRDATFDQYVSRELAFATGKWKYRDGDGDEAPGAQDSQEPRVTFDVVDYLGYREELRADIEATRARYGRSEHYVELEYGQLSDRAYIENLVARIFGERIDAREKLRQPSGRPKIEYLTNPGDAAPFTADSIRDGFAQP